MRSACVPLLVLAALWTSVLGAAEPSRTSDRESREIAAALQRAGSNRGQIERALQQATEPLKPAMRFLVRYMPERDLQSLKADFLLDNVREAHGAWRAAPWRDQVSEALFLNNILPYANVSESREAWRKKLRERFLPLIEGIRSPGEAAATLNQKLFPLLKVKYSRKRLRADQSPSESMQTGTASCTGLSILLIDACRSVGIPARFVGTALWSDRSGNHSWVEVWDDGWHFTGAAEPTGKHLDRAWFTGRASKADREHPLHAIYAVSYKRTPQTFPMVWNRRMRDVYAVNVTDRYAGKDKRAKLPEGYVRIMFRALAGPTADRCSANLVLKDPMGKVVYRGKTNDERFDANDHVTAALKRGEKYRVEITHQGTSSVHQVTAKKEGELVTIQVPADAKKPKP